MSQDDNISLANAIVRTIWNDLSERKGIGDALDACDDDIKREIKDDWKTEILQILRKWG